MSLPFDLLEEKTEADTAPPREAFSAVAQVPGDADVDAVLDLLSGAQRPLILVGSVMSNGRADSVRRELGAAMGVPVICMESPRGLNDPALGRLAGVVARADLLVLLGKEPDFTLRFGQAPSIDPACRIAVIDPEPYALQRARDVLGQERIVFTAVGDSIPTAQRLVEKSTGRKAHARDWSDEVEAALRFRPREWAGLGASDEGAVHPVEVGRAVQGLVDASADAVFVADGGEFGQWAQACVNAATRVINGPAGSIGSAIPFALASKIARPRAQVVAMTGDGAVGFHLLELDTALRAGLPVVIVVGNDACWNAEHQIQLRTYGKARAHGCELLHTRYDQIAAALGGHGELVTMAAQLPAALARAAASGKAAVVNVMIQRLAAPVYGGKT